MLERPELHGSTICQLTWICLTPLGGFRGGKHSVTETATAAEHQCAWATTSHTHSHACTLPSVGPGEDSTKLKHEQDVKTGK